MEKIESSQALEERLLILAAQLQDAASQLNEMVNAIRDEPKEKDPDGT